MSAATRYDRWAGDYSITDPVPRPMDMALRAVCRGYAAARPENRAKHPAAPISDAPYALWQFARRCAVFAMRERELDFVVDGLTAVALLDPRRVDPRDVSSPLPLLAYAARAIGAGPEPLFAAAAELAPTEMREVIATFLQRPEPSLRDWLYAAVETPSGPGFVDMSVEPYDPAGPLDRVALALADAIGSNGYERGAVTLATKMPRIWLEGVDDAALSHALRAVRAAASIHAGLQPATAADGDHESRGMIVFLAELADAPSAAGLLRIAEAKSATPSEIALLGVGAGRLFCLLVARSFVQGVAPVETSRSLRRFEPRVSEILRDYGPSNPIA